MYRRPKFLEILISIRQDMAREADYDVDLFAEMVRTGRFSNTERGSEDDESRMADSSKPEMPGLRKS